MSAEKLLDITVTKLSLSSVFLKRTVLIDCYYPEQLSSLNNISVLLINDGQDLRTMKFEEILSPLIAEQRIEPILCVGIHASTDRKNEYGTAHTLDYKGRGAKAALYHQFVMQELLPFIRKHFSIFSFKQKSFAGFSLGGLSALDIVWSHANEFNHVAVFSGSLWWRDKDQDDEDFEEEKHRIMHRLIRNGHYAPWLKFFFEVGTFDETNDRNGNGIIDSIDDTQSLIEALTHKGYQRQYDIKYLEIKDGRHDVATWARAFPEFLTWIWGINTEIDN